MIWRSAVTVRLPGARTAPGSRTCTCGQTGREKTGTKTPMTLRKAIGKERMAILAGRREHEFHCRSIVTQIPINPTFKGVWSRAVNFAPLSPPDTTLGQYRQHHRQLDDSPGHHGPEGSAYCPQRSARASPA